MVRYLEILDDKQWEKNIKHVLLAFWKLGHRKVQQKSGH